MLSSIELDRDNGLGFEVEQTHTAVRQGVPHAAHATGGLEVGSADPSATLVVSVSALGSDANFILVEAIGNKLTEWQPLEAADMDKIRADRSDAGLKGW
ncbi:MAG TPA: hypothetical protein VGP18_10730 [Solirubrobacteraceae bacterium]|nr:hypothetical protein [Solirubrobacteraceae bacterium]